jgi:hypothetical protein
MTAWLATSDEGKPEGDARTEEDVQRDEDVVVDLAPRRLRQWLRGMFGGKPKAPRPEPPGDEAS